MVGRRGVGHPNLRAVALAALVVLALAIGGCGGGDEAPAEEALPPMKKAQLAERMGDICQEHTDTQVVDIERFDKKEGLVVDPTRVNIPPGQQERELVEVMLPIVEDTIHDLDRKLRPSEQQAATLKAFLRALEHGVSYSRKDPSWIVTGEAEPFYKARLLAVELGTSYCGQA